MITLNIILMILVIVGIVSLLTAAIVYDHKHRQRLRYRRKHRQAA